MMELNLINEWKCGCSATNFQCHICVECGAVRPEIKSLSRKEKIEIIMYTSGKEIQKTPTKELDEMLEVSVQSDYFKDMLPGLRALRAL